MGSARLSWALFETAIGTVGVAWKGPSLLAIQLPEGSSTATAERLLGKAPGAERAEPPARIARHLARIARHLAGERVDLSILPVDLEGQPPFRRAVYAAARAIPSGARATYGELAARLGKPGAARAVGAAMANNPLPIVVPCHRVVAAGGRPGGFSAHGGLAMKAELLALEGAALEGATTAKAKAKTKAKTKANATTKTKANAKPARALPRTEPLPLPPDPERLPPPYDLAAAVRHLSATDPTLGGAIAAIGPCALTLEPYTETFPALAKAIVYQQLHARAASTIFGRVRAVVGGALSAAALAAAPDETLRAAGLSANKLAALRDLAARDLAGQIPGRAALEQLTDAEIVERLTAVRGIGPWTVEMLLIFRLGRPDVLPTTDYGVRQGFARAFALDALPKPAEVAARGERWRPFRSVASWYLWRMTDGA